MNFCPYYFLLLIQTPPCLNICVLWPTCSETSFSLYFFSFGSIVYHVPWAFYYRASGSAGPSSTATARTAKELSYGTPEIRRVHHTIERDTWRHAVADVCSTLFHVRSKMAAQFHSRLATLVLPV